MNVILYQSQIRNFGHQLMISTDKNALMPLPPPHYDINEAAQSVYSPLWVRLWIPTVRRPNMIADLGFYELLLYPAKEPKRGGGKRSKIPSL